MLKLVNKDNTTAGAMVSTKRTLLEKLKLVKGADFVKVSMFYGTLVND